MHSARNIAGSKQRHEQCSFGVALSIAIPQHPGRRDTVIHIISKQYLIPDKCVNSLQAFKLCHAIPLSLSDEPPDISI